MRRQGSGIAVRSKGEVNKAPSIELECLTRAYFQLLASDNMSELDVIGVMEGTDKSSVVGLACDYLRHYDELFQKWRRDDINIIEIGVLGGASLRT
jgi:hypothetical protein